MKKFTMLLFLSLLLVQVAFTQTVDVIYNVTREAYPTALPAEGASFSITYTNGANPVVTETKTVDATGAVTFTVPLPATGTNYRLAETITLADHNPYTSTSTNGTRITEFTGSPYYTSKFVGLTSTTLKVLVTKDVAASGTPIEGASVTFTCANPVINTTVVTGADGYALLPVTRGSAADYTIVISIAPITGYVTPANVNQIIPYIPSGNLNTRNIAMMWLYPVNFTVTKSDGVTPVQGAVVTCTGNPASTAQTTGADGKVAFSKVKANFNYTIITPGYADTTATVQSATIIDPLNLTIKLRSAFTVNLTITDASAVLVTGALVTLKPKNSAIAATSVTTTATGVAAFPKKTNGTYIYTITKSGFADVAGELTISDADINQGITLNAGADFTFYIKNGTTNISADSLTINGITKVSPSNGTIVFGLTAGTHEYSNTKVAFVKEQGSITVDPANPTLNNLTLNLVPIYSLKVQTKDENYSNVVGATVIFNGNTYKTDATGTVIIPNIAPKADTERQYYDVRIMKDGYSEYNDSIKCGLISTRINQKNQHAIDGNVFIFSKPGISINYSEGMMGATAYVTLYINGVDQSSAISYMGGGSISNVAPGIYSYWMNYLKPGYAAAHGTIEVKANQGARISVVFAKGYDIQMYTLDADNNPVEGAYVTLDDTTMRTGVDGDVLFKMRKEKSTYAYTAYQKDGSGKIIAKAKGQVTLGTVPITGEVIHLVPVADSILVNVMDLALWQPIVGATVKCDNETFVSDAQGIAVIPVTADSAAYTFTTSFAGYFDVTNTVTVDSSNVTEFVYMNKQYSASFTINDGTNPIEGAVIKVNGMDGITGTTGQLTFDKVFKKSWDGYNFTVSVIGYPDYTGTFYVSTGDVVVDPISFTTMAYDVTLTVNKPNGTPAAYAQVTFNNEVYTTNALGMLSATKVINGSYPIVISAPGYIDYAATVTVADANVNQTITLTGGYDLTIQVINGATGTVGLANTSITINDITKITDAGGMVTFGVPANYAVNTTITKAGFADAPLVIADVNANITSTVYMTPIYNVNIRVMDNNSYNPIQGATVIFNGDTKLSDVDGFAKYLNIAPSAEAYAYSVTGPGTYNSASGTIDLPFSSPAEYIETANEVNLNAGLTSPYVYIALTSGMMGYKGAATITFDGVDYAYDAGLGGNTFNCTLGTHTYVVTPANEAKAILRGTVELTEAEQTAALWLNVVNGRMVEIFVVDKNIEPIEGAEVNLNGITLSTDASGEAKFMRFVPGNYTYTISKAGYISITSPIAVNDVDVLIVDTLFMPEYSATFTVTDGTLNIEGANVKIGDVTVATGVDGIAVFTGLTAGTYDYTVSKAGYVTKTGSVTVIDANVTESVTLLPATYSITFNVTDGTTAIANAIVNVGMTNVFTGVDGKAVFTGLLPAVYNYMVTAAGYDTIFSSVTVVDADVTENVTMKLTVYTLTLTITDGSAAVQDASVTVGPTTVVTGADGKAVFADLLPGEYTYTVTATGFAAANGSATITNVNVVMNVVLLSDVGLNLTRNGSINAYPNPTKGNLSVNLPDNKGKGVTIIVTNVIGKVVLQNKVVNSSTGFDLDLSGFDNGVYFVKVIGSGFQNTVKVVKN